MGKVAGVKSVDFKIMAKGHGAVNWNGSVQITGEDGKVRDNHSIPKLRGYTNLSGKVKEENGYKYKKEAADIDFKKNPLYISQNCLRHHLFKDQSFDTHYATEKNIDSLLSSTTGLLRGYVIPSSQCKRTSPMFITDLVDQLGNGNFEQFGNAGEKNSNSIFSKTTFGDTEYIGYGSINMELLQFISMDAKYDMQAMVVKEGQGEEVAKSVQELIQSLASDANMDVQATFHANYVRKGTIYHQGSAGILLNQDAMKVMVQTAVGMIEDVCIQQAKGYMYVDSVLVDFNDGKPMRIKRDEGSISEEPQSEFAVYYESEEA